MSFSFGINSIRAKLTAIMAVLALLSIVPLSFISYLAMKDAVEREAERRLSSIAKLQTHEFERFLESIDRDLRLRAVAPFVIQGLVEMTAAFSSVDDATEALQAAYIDENPYPEGEKDLLLAADDGTAYDKAHALYHDDFNTLRKEMGYYDVFLFDTDGNLVYSVFKERDFATNMLSGEWRNSGLADAFRRANSALPDDRSIFVDFAAYAPSAGAPAAFIARPVFAKDGTRVGVISYQMPIDELNATVGVVTADQTENDAFLVNSDGLLITDSPRSETDDFLETRFEGPALVHGLRGEEGLVQYTDAQGNAVLSYYAPVRFLGTDWVIVFQEKQSSLFESVYSTRRLQIVVGVGAFVSTLFVAALFSRGISLPLQNVTGIVQRVAAKDYAVSVPATDRSDEIGRIARALNNFRMDLSAAEAGARDAAFKGAAFESTGAPMLLTDLDLRIVGANRAFFRMLNENKADFGVSERDLDLEAIVGRELAVLTFPPAEIRAAVRDHARLPIRKKIGIGESFVGLLIDIVQDKEGAAIGYVLDMKNQTFQMLSETVITAIDAQQARVEFDLDRRVRIANEKSLEVLGYELSGLLGLDGDALVEQDCDAAQRIDFWQNALDGQGTVGRFRIKTSDGVRIIEGNFSPVPDQDGVTKGFLLIGADVTEVRRQIEAAERQRAEEARELARVVETLSMALARVADGDLSALIDAEFTADYERLRNDFNAAVSKLGDAMRTVIENAGSIGSEATGINSAVSELSRRTESQAATLEQTTAAMTELLASVTSSAQEAQDAARVATEARNSAEASGKIVHEAADAMVKIESSSHQVSKIISVIDDIAFQTNLLALNAGVEAARAGDAGRGFAVVASEVRALAQRCLEASNEISALINVSGENVTKGVALVGEAGAALESISASVLKISDNVAHIAEASHEQSGGLNEISTALVNLDQMTQHNAAMAEETTAATQALLNEADALTATTRKFTVGHAGKDVPSIQLKKAI